VALQCEKQNLPAERWPKFLREMPTLLCGLDLYMTAFSDLSTCRAMGLSPGPIPYTSILEYCRFHGFDHETSLRMTIHLTAMDHSYLKHKSPKKE